MAIKPKTKAMVHVAMGTALIAVCAWISLPFGAIPVTLQTLAVCLVAGLLGAKKGVAATGVYILLGAVGMPVFSGFKGGIGVLFGATGGYVAGFLLTALLVGIVAEKQSERFFILLTGMAVGVLLCYAFGTLWFSALYAKGIREVLSLCVLPFIVPDSIKIALAAGLTVIL